MKRVLILASIILLAAGTASADQVNFIWDTGAGGIETLQGVDPDTGGWSDNSSTVNLNTNTWSLLGGTGSVNAYVNCGDGLLTQTGTRGLGIFGGGEGDEIDTGLFRQEKLVVSFEQPKYLNSLEVRSLFYEPIICNFGYSEIGVADFWLGDEKVFTQSLIGTENIRINGTDGSAVYEYDKPYEIDKIVFYVPNCQVRTLVSDFSVAKMDVTTAPEPVSTALFILGGATLAARKLRRK